MSNQISYIEEGQIIKWLKKNDKNTHNVLQNIKQKTKDSMSNTNPTYTFKKGSVIRRT